jgi:hypothetical protein
MSVQVQKLHTYFLFPFSIDQEGVREEHGDVFPEERRWIDCLDDWITQHPSPFPGLQWVRSPYTQFDLDSRAYQQMVLFHPIVRRVFFDATGQEANREALLRCYRMHAPSGAKLLYEIEDAAGVGATIDVCSLSLYLFANGIGILTIGVEAANISASQALWINEMMRRVYPSSGRQVREGRTPLRSAFLLDRDGVRACLTGDSSEHAALVGFQPPLTRAIKDLLYFSNYDAQEFEPVLDERMIVYSYVQLDPLSLPEGYKDSEAYQILLSRILYVEQDGDDYRYDVDFVRERMQQQLYRRWAHQGTYYGFTTYSNVTVTLGEFDCGRHGLAEGFLIHRMFDTRYYLMALVSLFYRAALLDFGERTALVSRHLYESGERLSPECVAAANQLRREYLHFSNYWHFDELANKEEEIEHFDLQCRFYRIAGMKLEVEKEIGSLGNAIEQHQQYRNTEAINRVAMLSMILGIGAMVTGFFGMNFGREFADRLFEPREGTPWLHWSAIGFVVLIVLGVLLFSIFVVAINWTDYRNILDPRGQRVRTRSLRKDEPL